MDIKHVTAGADHIVALEPLPGVGLDRALSIVWAVGRRCNYACSYCTTEFHDKVSPHRTFEEFCAVWENIKRAMAKQGLFAASIEFTGGEATMNPDFLPFVRYLNETQRPWLRLMGLTSNGSASLEYYEQLMDNIDWLTLSTHFEWWDEDHFMTMLLDLKRSLARRQRNAVITINVMYEEWSAAHLEKVKKILDAERIRTTPLVIYNIYGSKGIINKSSKPFDYDAYLASRGEAAMPSPISNPNAVETPAASPAESSVPPPPESAAPAPAESAMPIPAENSASAPAKTARQVRTRKSLAKELLEHSSQLETANAKITLNDGSVISIHSQVLINLHLNSFPGWKCHVGMDRIFINVDGTVYGGMCRMIKMGHMLDRWTLSDEPVDCDGRNCFCMSDLITKKWGTSGVHTGTYFGS